MLQAEMPHGGQRQRAAAGRGQLKRLVVWAIVHYAGHVDGAKLHITGPDERQVVFGDGTTSLATLSGGEGSLNSSVTLRAPDFVLSSGRSLNEMMALIQAQQVTLVSQQAEIEALKRFVGMMPQSSPSSSPHPVYTGGHGRAFGHNGHSWANEGAFAALAADGSIQAWGDSGYGGTGAPSGAGYTALFSTYRAFAALAADGSIQAWGNSAYGGTGAPSGAGFTMFVSVSPHDVYSPQFTG
jgi:hypothetical protein